MNVLQILTSILFLSSCNFVFAQNQQMKQVDVEIINIDKQLLTRPNSKQTPDFVDDNAHFVTQEPKTGIHKTNADNIRIQFIHASPDSSIGSAVLSSTRGIEIWLGTTSGRVQVGTSALRYRRATPFITMDAASDTIIVMANNQELDKVMPGTMTVAPGMAYIGIATGVRTPSTYPSNPEAKPTDFKLTILSGIDTVPKNSYPSAVKFFNAVPDLPMLTVGQFRADGRKFSLNGFGFLDSTIYIGLPTPPRDSFSLPLEFTHLASLDSVIGNYGIKIRSTDNGQTIFGFISGLENDHPGIDNDAPHIYLVRKNGNVVDMTEWTYVQFINNSPDPLLNNGEWYYEPAAGPQKVFNNFKFPFRKGSHFLVLPLALSDDEIQPLPWSFKGPVNTNSTGPVDLFLSNRKDNILMAYGVLEPNNYAANPNGVDATAKVFFTNDIRPAFIEMGVTYNKQIEFRFLHCATDMAKVTLKSETQGETYTPAGGLRLDQYSNYGMFDVAIQPLQAFVVTEMPSNTILAKHEGLLDSMFESTGDPRNRRAFIFTSGFWDPSANRNGAGYALMIAYPQGDVATNFASIQPIESIFTDIDQNLAETPEPQLIPNPANDYAWLYLNGANGSYQMIDMQGRIVKNEIITDGTLPIELNLKGLASGLYHCNIIAGNKNYTRKLIKN